MVLSVEDVIGEYRSEEIITDSHGKQIKHTIMVVDKIVDRIVKMMISREKLKRPYGVIVVAEGLAEYLPHQYLEGIPRDDHGHISVASVNLGKMLSKLVQDAYKKATGNSRKVTGLQLVMNRVELSHMRSMSCWARKSASAPTARSSNRSSTASCSLGRWTTGSTLCAL